LRTSVLAASRPCPQLEETDMWLRNPQWWLVALLVIIAASSSYNSYKLYQMTDGKAAVTSAKKK
jgi:hypothetical protein